MFDPPARGTRRRLSPKAQRERDAYEEEMRKQRLARLVNPAPRPAPPPPFGGETYDPDLDGARLTGQLGRVLSVMRDGEWRTLSMIAGETGDPEASVSARLRDFRKAPFGGHEMDAERITGGLWRYRLRLQARSTD